MGEGERIEFSNIVSKREKVELRRLRAATFAAIPKELVGIADFSIEEHCEDLWLGLRAHVMAEHIVTETVAARVPATWWDHFKRDAIPTLSRFLRLEVMTVPESVRFEQYVKYPRIHRAFGPGVHEVIVRRD